MNIGEFLRRLVSPERRYHAEPVEVNRRESGRLTMREAEKTLQISLDGLKRAVGASENGKHQRVVIWATFWPGCTHGTTAGVRRYCSNPDHPDSGLDAVCDEEHCPFMLGVA